MRLVIRLLGLDLLDIEAWMSTPEDGEPDYSRDLSGGTTYASPRADLHRQVDELLDDWALESLVVDA